MKIHEYQAKEVLARYGVAVPRGVVIDDPGQAEAAARDLGTNIVVVKAQIHAGGRGKGGGVKLAKTPGEAKSHASKIIGMTLVTPQGSSRPPPLQRTRFPGRKRSESMGPGEGETDGNRQRGGGTDGMEWLGIAQNIKEGNKGSPCLLLFYLP